MSIVNTSKPTTSFTNLARVFSAITWDAEIHTWNNDPYTWDQKATNLANTARVSASITNIVKPS